MDLVKKRSFIKFCSNKNVFIHGPVLQKTDVCGRQLRVPG